MAPEYMQKLLDLLELTDFTTARISAFDEFSTVYEAEKLGYIFQVTIWDKGVHEFTVGTRVEILLHQCDFGTVRDYQVFEEFIKNLL